MLNAQKVTMFVAPTGEAFGMLSNYPSDGELLYSSDGHTFYALGVRGIGGRFSENEVDANFTFDNPHNGASGRLHRINDTIEFDGVKYVMQDFTVDMSSVVPLPATRRTEYLCQSEDGMLIYVSADKYNFSYKSFKLFIGDGATMREVSLTSGFMGGVQRYRDGGTTYIYTSEEVFFSPSPSKAQHDPFLVPMWGTHRLARLNKDDFDIVETPEGKVSITKR